MTITPAAICSMRECTAPATDLFAYQWHNRTHQQPRCHAHYLQGLRNNRYLATDPADRY
ncbi:hypothetical protein IU449_28665 [Nocardia higoensis]|uniref:Uncharacterized protein n=1 Tax=Nocardia higoensis TaxID=228599 RepID=A0ABS0DJ58_9NOCA|nr:hypothetical protein [Nocardia higoensis]MBF6358474.1 hypothetical protein [Nocardia higoensis]